MPPVLCPWVLTLNQWPASNPNSASLGVTRSNNSAPCQALTAASTPFFDCPASSSTANTCNVFVNATQFADRETYAFRGSNSANAAACPANPGSSQQIFAGAIVVGTFAYDCASATTRQACQALIPGNVAAGQTSRYGACVWCGFGSNTDTDGFCYTPPWSGVNSCPCQNCIADYKCPADARGFFCASACFQSNSTSVCPAYVRTAGVALQASLALLALLASLVVLV